MENDVVQSVPAVVTAMPSAFETVVFFLGYIVHFIQKCLKEGIKFRDYWAREKPLSVASFASAWGVLMGQVAYAGQSGIELTMVTLFATGFAVDSLINRAPQGDKLIIKNPLKRAEK